MIGPLQAIENFYFRYFQFSGRATRAEYNWYSLYALSVGVALFLLEITSSSNPNFASLGVFYLVNTIPAIALLVRRLHDFGWSGFAVCLLFIPFVSFFISLMLVFRGSDSRENSYGAPQGRSPKSSNRAMGAYASLVTVPDVNKSMDPEMADAQEEARRREINAYYRTRVLGQQN